MKCLATVLAALLPALAPLSVAFADDPVRATADDAYPRLSSLAMKIAHAKWEQRADELMTNAPLSAKPGETWKAGDPHWDAARAEMLAKIDGWAKQLLEDDAAREIVRGKFAKGLTAAQAATMQSRLADPKTSGFPAVSDSIHLGVVFAGDHKELPIGSAEFSKAFASWSESLGLPREMPASSPELDELMRSEAGRAYSTARGFAIDALVSGLDGEIQLRFYDAQQAILAGIEARAKECAKAKHAAK